MAAPSMPKFRKTEPVKEPPKSAAEVLARSAEAMSRGKLKTGRKPGPEPTKNVTVSLPVRIIEALDALAAERTGRNRSFALLEVLEGRLKLHI